MTLLFLIFIALALAAGFVMMVMSDPGYVLITLKPWSVEMSLALFITLLVAAFVVLYLVIRALAKLWRSPRDLGAWHSERTQNKARRMQTIGIMRVIEGEWQQAERYLLSYLNRTDAPALNYLGAAHAAQGRGDYKKRDEYLALAVASDPNQAVAIGLTKATLQYRSGQYGQASETLRELRNRAPKNQKVLGLSLKVLEHTHDWDTLSRIIPAARKQNAAPELEIDRLQQMTNTKLLTRATEGGEMHQLWRSLSREQRTDPELLATYVERLLDQDMHKEAEELVRKYLQRNWDARLVRLYGQIRAPDPAAQLKHAERWAASHQDSPELMLSLAQISLNNELWGKARSYLEACISNGGTVEAYRELGHLLEQLDEKESALDLYRKGIDQAVPHASTADEVLTGSVIESGIEGEIDAPQENAARRNT